MFFQCPKCQRVWQYPIEKCPECFLGLERMDQGEIRIIGVSEVKIPTILHPKTPYFVLLLEDERGNRWVQKSVKEYKIGDKFEIEPAQEENAVAIWKTKYDIYESWERVVELIGGIKIETEKKILILPTLILPKHPYLAENTSPEFLEATIEYLLKKGARKENIKVASQSFNEFPIGAAAQKSQLLRVCQEKEVEPLNLSQESFLKKDDLKISQKTLEADIIINLPRLKIGQARATENVFKLLEKENYFAQKYLSDEGEIFEKLKRELPPVLTVAQADSVQREDGIVIPTGLTMASSNPLHIDRVFSQISKSQLPEILKNVNIQNIEVVGRKIEELECVF